jgi:NAD dependent epimerase/dehydratase family enzyme
MLPVFRLGLGGAIGNGRAWMSWIHLSDAARAFVHALQEPRLTGAYNLVAPQPVQNHAFTKCLGQTLHRPAVLPVPPLALRLLMGEMAGALTQSARVDSHLLQQTGWRPEFPQLGPAFKDLLG